MLHNKLPLNLAAYINQHLFLTYGSPVVSWARLCSTECDSKCGLRPVCSMCLSSSVNKWATWDMFFSWWWQKCKRVEWKHNDSIKLCTQNLHTVSSAYIPLAKRCLVAWHWWDGELHSTSSQMNGKGCGYRVGWRIGNSNAIWNRWFKPKLCISGYDIYIYKYI